MSWKWEELTSPEFTATVEACQGVCLVPMGVLEKHGDHLPLGIDVLHIMNVAERAAAIEPAIIFPQYYFGQIHEARQWSGTIALKHDLLFALLENVCEEISRNGMKKIVLLNGHGGNESMLALFLFRMLEQERDFTLYTIRLSHYMSPVLTSLEWKAQMVSAFDEHGGEGETSTMMAINPDLVKMDALSAPGNPLKRLQHLPPGSTPAWWYADYPDHYAGDATHATPEKGEFLINAYSQKVAEHIKAIKEDTVTPQLLQEFYSRTQH